MLLEYAEAVACAGRSSAPTSLERRVSGPPNLLHMSHRRDHRRGRSYPRGPAPQGRAAPFDDNEHIMQSATGWRLPIPVSDERPVRTGATGDSRGRRQLLGLAGAAGRWRTAVDVRCDGRGGAGNTVGRSRGADGAAARDWWACPPAWPVGRGIAAEDVRLRMAARGTLIAVTRCVQTVRLLLRVACPYPA